MKNMRNNKGMTLIEVILAMAIFGIIASSFLTLFTSSIVWIFGAGDRGEAYTKAQSEVESSIASGDSYSTADMEIKFGAKNYTIQGGLVESNQIVNQSNSTLRTFVASLPTIQLHPKVRYEGDQSTLIEIIGLNTNFNTTTIVEVFDYSGQIKIGSFDVNETSLTNASFNLNGLNLLNGDYIIRTTTNISGKPNEVSRARYTVSQPRFLVGGENNIYISSDGINWVDRAAFGTFPAVSNINSVAFNGSRYVLASNLGQVIYSTEKELWNIKSIAIEDLNEIIWSYDLGEFFALGASGGIYKSGQDLNFVGIYPTSNTLNGITTIKEADGTNRLVAVGENEILYSTNGFSWISSFQSEGTRFNDVAARAGLFVTVGEKVIGVSNNGTIWTINSSVYILNDVISLPGAGKFIAVGNEGAILSSVDGVVWTPSLINKDISAINFHSVHSRAGVVIVVGDGGSILYSDDYGATFDLLEGLGITDNLMSISGE